jgi:RecA-family ATPase
MKGAIEAEPEKLRLETMRAPEFGKIEFPELPDIIPGFLTQGLTVFAGRPKAGKSWMMLNVGTTIASGGKAFGHLNVEQGDVLYLALEDYPGRLQNRLFSQLQAGELPPRLHLLGLKANKQFKSMRRLDEGGLEDLDQWLTRYKECRLVIIDTYARVAPNKPKSKDPYQDEYDNASEFQNLALEHEIALILVHHTRKSDATSRIDTIRGSGGVTAAADTYWILNKGFNEDAWRLHVEGRDTGNSSKHVFEFDQENFFWELKGDVSQHDLSPQRQVIFEYLKANGPSTPTEIAKANKLKPGNVRQLLMNMVIQKTLTKSGPKYSIQKLFND